MQPSILFTLGLGFALGLKHATEADHLAAVSSIVSERRSVLDSARVGALWGLGHTASLMLAGLLVIGLGIVFPQRLANMLELTVAIMIIVLGSRVLYRVHAHSHSHLGQRHFHLHFHEAGDAHSARYSHEGPHSSWSRGRTFLVGVVHGLAGSAALTLLVLTGVIRGGSPALGLVYLLVFGAGSIGGMTIMSCLLGLPFVIGLKVSPRFPAFLQVSAASASIVFGFFYAWRILS